MKRILFYLGQPLTFILKTIVIVMLFITKINIITKKIKNPTLPKLPKVHISLPQSYTKYIGVAIFLLLIYLVRSYLLSLPTLDALSEPPSLTTKILDRNGELLYQIYRDENRSLIKLSSLPKHLVQATLVAEDKNFYSHPGIDIFGIIRAFGKNVKNCHFFTKKCSLEGGSTLTQQLVKNTLLTSRKTLDRKIKEAILALQVEKKYSKDEILEFYLNEVSYGGTAYGIQAAAQTYFGKDAKDLTLSESALLAGITISPTTLSPLGNHPYLAKDRQRLILTMMHEDGHITEEEKNAAIESPIMLKPKNIAITAPHFVMWLKDQLVEEYGESMVSQGGLTIRTTIDLTIQRILEKEIANELDKLKKYKVGNGAGLITNPKNGEILAMVGSKNYYDYEQDGQVNITTSLRQPGSSIKPITYALAFMRGLSPSTTIEDSPICFTQKNTKPYCPKNYDGKFHGNVTLRTALASSYNIPAVKLLNSLGVNSMIKLAENLGITTWQDTSRFGLALTLGGGEVTMIDMAEVYGTFASKGIRTPLTGVIEVKDKEGNILDHKKTESKEVIPESVAFQISSILSDNNSRAPAFGTNSVLNITKAQVAVKTGTTNNLRDNWTFGYTEDILVATWVGNNDNTPMSSVVSGITGASPIWRHTIEKLIAKTSPKFTPPEGTKRIALCKETKTIYCKDICPSAPIYDYFSPGTEPKGNCETIKSGQILGTQN